MEILTGIFILFCVGVVTGYSLLYVRSHEGPKKETQKQVLVLPNQDPGRTAATLPEGGKEGQGISSPEQPSRESGG